MKLPFVISETGWAYDEARLPKWPTRHRTPRLEPGDSGKRSKDLPVELSEKKKISKLEHTLKMNCELTGPPRRNGVGVWRSTLAKLAHQTPHPKSRTLRLGETFWGRTFYPHFCVVEPIFLLNNLKKKRKLVNWDIIWRENYRSSLAKRVGRKTKHACQSGPPDTSLQYFNLATQKTFSGSSCWTIWKKKRKLINNIFWRWIDRSALGGTGWAYDEARWPNWPTRHRTPSLEPCDSGKRFEVEPSTPISASLNQSSSCWTIWKKKTKISILAHYLKMKLPFVISETGSAWDEERLPKWLTRHRTPWLEPIDSGKRFEELLVELSEKKKKLVN